MQEQLTLPGMDFKPLASKKVVADFLGGNVSSDAGGLLLRQANEGTNIIQKLADCFTDFRNPKFIEHSVEELLAQRIFGLALGYDDLNDHDDLRRDPLMATLVNKADPTGKSRKNARDMDCPLAGKSTLNRLELGAKDFKEDERYKKILLDQEMVHPFFVQHFIDTTSTPPEEIILDVDATDSILHGKQEECFFHGYYGNYCYLPLYIFSGDYLLCARLRPSNIDGAQGCLEELQPIIAQIRKAWPQVRIIVRGDSGFCRDNLMTWCEQNGVYYIFGISKNNRLIKKIKNQLEHVRRKSIQTQTARRTFRSFYYKPLKNWDYKRYVVGKAEHLPRKSNPRFIVTNLLDQKFTPKELYEEVYCARGDMENRIKEQQLCLFSDRMSSSVMRANQLRCWFSGVAYMLMTHIRRVALKGTKLAKAQCSTIRNKLLKIGAIVKVSVRRVYVSIASSFPLKEVFLEAKTHMENWVP